MDLSDSKKDRAKQIVSMLYSPPGVVGASELLLDRELYEEVQRTISSAHELYIDTVSEQAILRYRADYETGYERPIDRYSITDQTVLFILYMLYRHPFIPEELRTGKPTASVDVAKETVLRVAEKAKMSKVAVEKSLSRLTRLGYLEGQAWPRRVGMRLRALPPDLFEKFEEEAFRWQIITDAGLETEKVNINPALILESVQDAEDGEEAGDEGNKNVAS